MSFVQKECISVEMPWFVMVYVVLLHTCIHTTFEVNKNA